MNEVDFVASAARHMPDGDDIALLTAEHGGDWYGACAVRRAGRYGHMRLGVLTSQVRRMTYLGTPLLDGGDAAGAMACLLGAAAGERRRMGYRMMVLHWLGDGGPAGAAVRDACGALGHPVHEQERFEQPFLARGDGGETAAGGQGVQAKKKHRKDYERRARRLSEHLGAELELVDRAGDPAAVDEFIELEAAGYKWDAGVAMATRPGEPEAFRALCRGLADQERLRLLQLRAAGTTVAMQISVRAGSSFFMIKVGHDEQFARFDPGIQMHFRAVDQFHDTTDGDDLRVCTFADNDLLLRLYPDRRPTSTLVIGLGGPFNHAVVRSLPAARSMAGRLRH